MISPLAVKTHVSHAMTKLDCRDRARVVAPAFEFAYRAADFDIGLPGAPGVYIVTGRSA